MPKKIDPAVKERALRMFADHQQEYPSDTALAEAVARKLGVGRETARRWLVQADGNAGTRPGTTGDEQAELKRLRAENRRLKEDLEILKAATVFFAGELDPTTADRGVHRRHDSPRSHRRVDLSSPARAGLPGRRADLPMLETTRPDGRGPDKDRCRPGRRSDGAERHPERLYGRRKMTHYLRREGHRVAFCALDRLMRDLRMNGVRRGKVSGPLSGPRMDTGPAIC